MAQRLTVRRRKTYNTASNRKKVVKTPGGRLTYIYCDKKAAIPKCSDCKQRLMGLVPARPRKLKNMSRRQKTVCRAYGGNKCSECVSDRIARAFLAEEQRIVKKVLKAKKSQPSSTNEQESVAPGAIEKDEKQDTSSKTTSTATSTHTKTDSREKSGKKITSPTGNAAKKEAAKKKPSSSKMTK